VESIDELARDFEKLLDQASPGFPSAMREMELRFHLINSLPDNLAFHLNRSLKQAILPQLLGLCLLCWLNFLKLEVTNLARIIPE